uniref:Thiolase N-terminal domain-containing protein n=1 Tax=Setaria digitata TaxID=48799 RepID=A0A915PFP4_9BILA
MEQNELRFNKSDGEFGLGEGKEGKEVIELKKFFNSKLNSKSIAFVKPGSIPNWDYPDMIKEAVNKALSDAKLRYSDVEQAVVGYIYGGTCCGQRALYEIGFTGIPIYNVNNACASGSAAVYLSKLCIEGGHANVALAVGFEKMKSGSLESMENFDDRTHPLEKHINIISDTVGLVPAPVMAQMFANAGQEHMEKYGTKREHFAKIAQKNHKHSINNP